MAPAFIEKWLDLGANVDISESGYAPTFIDKWVVLAVARGGHLTIRGSYAPTYLENWARAGGRHITIKVPASP